MVKMVSLERTKGERKAADDAMGSPVSGNEANNGPDGPTVSLQDHHMKKLGLEGPLKTGTKVELHMEGEVTGAHDDSYGKSMTLRMSKGNLLHDEMADDKDGGLRKQLEENTGKSMKADEDKAVAKAAKKGAGKAGDDETY